VAALRVPAGLVYASLTTCNHCADTCGVADRSQREGKGAKGLLLLYLIFSSKLRSDDAVDAAAAARWLVGTGNTNAISLARETWRLALYNMAGMKREQRGAIPGGEHRETASLRKCLRPAAGSVVIECARWRTVYLTRSYFSQGMRRTGLP
jgi:hypothetical protein